MRASSSIKKVRVPDLLALKGLGEPITMLTAYDYSMARLLDAAGIEVVLVGDSAANVVSGLGTTLPIRLRDMIYHACAVARACTRALVVVDMPFGSYQVSPKQALRSALRIMKANERIEGVKLEGGIDMLPQVKKITAAGIPVMGHIGLRPQSVHSLGGFGVQGTDNTHAKALLAEAIELEKAGCFAIVLEKIPAQLAAQISKQLHIPTIGIGAGKKVDGQVLVLHDMLGITPNFRPRFLRQYEQLAERITHAVQHYIQDVKEGQFPNQKEEY